MSAEQKQKFTIVSKESFIAIGFKWEGTFAEAAKGGIRKIQAELKERLDEIEGKVEEDVLLGLSYHATEASNGFFSLCMCRGNRLITNPSWNGFRHSAILSLRSSRAPCGRKY